MDQLKVILATSAIVLLSHPHYALSRDKSPHILQNIDQNLVQSLNREQRDAARGEYFPTKQAAQRFCATSYPGCKGAISFDYRKGNWRVKSRLTNRYLSY